MNTPNRVKEISNAGTLYFQMSLVVGENSKGGSPYLDKTKFTPSSGS